MKDEALSAAQLAAAAERDELAQELREAKEEVARLMAGPQNKEQRVTDNVKVGKAPRTCRLQDMPGWLAGPLTAPPPAVLHLHWW